MSRTAVFRWCSDFRHGRVSTADMPRPGQAHVVITEESIASVNSLVRENRRITTREIADSLSVSMGIAVTILHEQLN
jgi:ribosomal protein S25